MFSMITSSHDFHLFWIMDSKIYHPIYLQHQTIEIIKEVETPKL